MIALHRSCKGVGDYILILQLTLLEAPFEWNPRVLSKKPYYGNDLTRGGGEEKRYSKLLLDFFFSSRVAGKDHKTMKNNGLTASKKVSDWAPNTAHHVMCVSELSPGFGLKLHQISRWLTGNHQHKAARISPHYVAANCAASHDFTQTMFLFPGIIKKRTIKSIVQSRIATSIEFPDQSHLKSTRSARGGAAFEFALEQIAVIANISVIIVKYYHKELKKGGLSELILWKRFNVLFKANVMEEFVVFFFLHGSLQRTEENFFVKQLQRN